MPTIPDRADFKYTFRGAKGVYVKWNKPEFNVEQYYLFRTNKPVPAHDFQGLYSNELDYVKRFSIKADTTELLDDTDTKDARYLIVAVDTEGNIHQVTGLNTVKEESASGMINPFYLSIGSFKTTDESGEGGSSDEKAEEVKKPEPEIPGGISFRYVIHQEGQEPYLKWELPKNIDFYRYIVYRTGKVIPNNPKKLVNGGFDEVMTKFEIYQKISELVDDTGSADNRYLVLAFDKDGNTYNVDKILHWTSDRADMENPWYLGLEGFKDDAVIYEDSDKAGVQEPGLKKEADKAVEKKAEPAVSPAQTSKPEPASTSDHITPIQPASQHPDSINFKYSYHKDWDEAYITWNRPQREVAGYMVYKTDKAIGGGQTKDFFQGKLNEDVIAFEMKGTSCCAVDDTGVHRSRYLVLGKTPSGELFNVDGLNVNGLSAVEPSEDSYYLSSPDGVSKTAGSIREVELVNREQPWYLTRMEWDKPDIDNLSHIMVYVGHRGLEGAKAMKELLSGRHDQVQYYKVDLQFTGIIDNVNEKWGRYCAVSVDEDGVIRNLNWRFVEPPFDHGNCMTFMNQETGRQVLEFLAQNILNQARTFIEGHYAQYDHAVKTALQVFTILPDHQGTADFIQAVKDKAKAEAEEKRQNQISSMMDRAKTAISNGLYDSAVETLKELLKELDPDNQDAKELIEEAKTKKESAALHQEFLNLGRKQIHEKQYDEAKKTYESALDKFPKDKTFAEGLEKAKANIDFTGELEEAEGDPTALIAVGEKFGEIDRDFSYRAYEKARLADLSNVEALKKWMGINLYYDKTQLVCSIVRDQLNMDVDVMSYSGMDSNGVTAMVEKAEEHYQNYKDLYDDWWDAKQEYEDIHDESMSLIGEPFDDYRNRVDKKCDRAQKRMWRLDERKNAEFEKVKKVLKEFI